MTLPRDVIVKIPTWVPQRFIACNLQTSAFLSDRHVHISRYCEMVSLICTDIVTFLTSVSGESGGMETLTSVSGVPWWGPDIRDGVGTSVSGGSVSGESTGSGEQ